MSEGDTLTLVKQKNASGSDGPAPRTNPMSMPPYPVMCYAAGCPNRAAFKVAARWSDGVTDELKTYSLACADCLPGLYSSAVAKRAACRLAPGETLDAVGVYELTPATRDKRLKRRKDLEQQGKATP